MRYGKGEAPHYSLVDMRGSRDVLLAMRKQVRTWETPELMPGVVDLLGHCCDGDQELVRDYVAYLNRLDRSQPFEGRTVGDWLDDARAKDPRLAKLMDGR